MANLGDYLRPKAKKRRVSKAEVVVVSSGRALIPFAREGADIMFIYRQTVTMTHIRAMMT
jgi:hypothetical protein